MITESTLQAMSAHVMLIQQTSLLGFWPYAIHAKILIHFFTLTTKTTTKNHRNNEECFNVSKFWEIQENQVLGYGRGYKISSTIQATKHTIKI
jgi:hypothetical protein